MRQRCHVPRMQPPSDGRRRRGGGGVPVHRDGDEQIEDAALKLERCGLFAADDGHEEEVVSCTAVISKRFGARIAASKVGRRGAPSKILSSWSKSSRFSLSLCMSKNLCSSCPISAHPRFLQAKATLLRNTATSWLILATSHSFD